MKKWMKAALLGALAFGTMMGSTATADAKEAMKVSSSAAVLKSAASPSSSTLMTLSNGSFVVAQNEANGWQLVDYQGTYGAINKVALVGNLPYKVKISSSKGGIVIKQKPSPSSATVTALKYGMVMEDYGPAGNGYSFVRYGNVFGYAATSYIAAPKATIKYLSNQVSLRRIASPSGEITGSAAKHAKVEVYASIAGWSYIKVGKYAGYVASNQLIAQLPSAKPAAQPKSQQSAKPQQTAGDASSGYYVIPGAPTRFKNCKDMNAYYPNGVAKSHPAYATARDRDNDRWACERN